MSELTNQLKKVEFDENGLIKNFPYIYTDDGLVDWRAILFQRPEFLVPNKKNFEKRGKSIPENIEEIDDKDLLILLAGVKYIANIRQFLSVEYQVFAASPEFVSCKCRILWKGNYETSFKNIVFESMADASVHNTSSFAKVYLTAIAENRSFVRAVRNALRIPILGQDEIGTVNIEEEQPKTQLLQPTEILSKLLKDKNISFENAIKGMKDSENWKSIETTPKAAIFSIIGKLKLNK